MNIKELQNRSEVDQNKKLKKTIDQFNQLLTELRKQEINDSIVAEINGEIDQINSVTEKKLKSQKIKKVIFKLVRLIEKEHKIVPKNHYRNFWIAIGVGGIGLPIGTAFGVSLGNMGYIGIGMPIGIVIGLAIGISMDKKAFQEGRQLDIEVA